MRPAETKIRILALNKQEKHKHQEYWKDKLTYRDEQRLVDSRHPKSPENEVKYSRSNDHLALIQLQVKSTQLVICSVLAGEGQEAAIVCNLAYDVDSGRE